MRTISLKWRAVIGVTILTVTVLVSVSIVQLHYMRRDFTRVLSEQQFSLVARAAADIDSKFESYTEVLVRSSAQVPREILDDGAALREYYRVRPAILASFDDVLVFAPDGRIVADYPEVPGRAGLSAAGRPWFTRLVATRRPVISEPFIGRGRNEPIVSVNVPILDKDGRLRGVLQGVLRLYSKNFLASLAQAQVGRSGYFAILTREPQPRYVVHPDRKRILGPRVSGGSFSTSRALEGFEGSSEDISSTGVEQLYSYKQLRSVDWVLIAAQPLDEAYAPLEGAGQRLWLICLVVCLFVVPLVWGLAWLILRPVSHLRDEIDKLRVGGRGYRPVAVVSRDEIGDLTRGFNALMRERAIAESRHRDAEERLRMIADNLPALIGYLDSNLRYVFVNQAFPDWYGGKTADFIGKTLKEVVGEKTYDNIVGPMAQRSLEGETVTYQRVMEGRRGREDRHIETTFIPDRLIDGRIVGTYVLASDITALMRTKDELRALNVALEERVRERTAALAQTNRELETFAYSVAHDFRAPLRAMDGYSALLLEEQSARLDDEGREHLARIRASSNRMGKLIDDLLRLAELGQREVRRESVDLTAAAGAVAAELRAAHPRRDVQLRIPGGLTAHADRSLATALLRELLDNAWKFSARRPAARIELGMLAQDGVRQYFVSDDGTGFDMQYAHKIFTPFARLHGPEEFPGTGIGLALAKRIVERHGGRLWVQAREGEGAVFWFTLGGQDIEQQG
jgi:PAS domain S-box-containing protein